MGSSHSAPRRSSDRRRNSRQPLEGGGAGGSFHSPYSPSGRPRARVSRDQLRQVFDGDNSFSSRVDDELPSLLEENPDGNNARRNRLSDDGANDPGRLPSNLTAMSSDMDEASRRDRMLGLSVIQSCRSLRPEDMDVDLPLESFSNEYAEDLVGSPEPSPVPTDMPRTGRKAVAIGMTGEVSSHELPVSPMPDEIAMPVQRPALQPPLTAQEQPSQPHSPQDNGGEYSTYLSGSNASGPPPAATYSNSPYLIPHESSSVNGEDDHGPPIPMPAPDFFPHGSRYNEWMGRSVETLILGYGAVAPILCLPEDEDDRGEDYSTWGQTRRRSTVSTLGSELGRRSSLGSIANSRRGSLVGGGNMHGGTLANYYSRRRTTNDSGNSRRGSNQSAVRGSSNRRGSASHGPTYRRRLSMSRSMSGDSGNDESRPGAANGGPNIALSLLARETTGRLTSRNFQPAAHRLRDMGGNALFGNLDRPAGGMCSEVAFLSEVIDSGDWAETQTVVSRISPRLIGDPSAAANGPPNSALNDPNLPPTASPYYGGGGRLGLERDAFVLAGGVEVLIRVFREPSFVGAEMARTYDARDLSEELVANRLAPCWNEALASLRELVYAIPSLVENEIIFDDGEFVPFLFTLLSHDSCFDGAAALVEEILSLQSHSPPQAALDADAFADGVSGYQPTVRVSPATTFFLGNVPDLYKLWGGFNCRQLAHFCRILALLVFEPEDRQLLESPAVLKSIELLQLRRNRAARAGRDSTVDMNQAILLGDEELTKRLLKLLRVMNFAPSLRRSSPYHVMAHFPFIADTLVMLGLNELDDWDEIDRLEGLARKSLAQRDEGSDTGDLQLSELGSVADMLESLSGALMGNQAETAPNQLSHIVHVISAAQQAGVVVGRPRQGRARRRDQNENGGLAANDQGRMASSGTTENTFEELSSSAGLLSDQVLVRRLYPSGEPETPDDGAHAGTPIQVVGIGFEGGNGFRDSFSSYHGPGNRRPRLNTPEDAANSLQFNALLLGPYQVEVLFVLCTLLGGRRKIDAQEMLNECGVIPILDDMFQRLPWDSLSPTRQPISQDRDGSTTGGIGDVQQTGIHGPGCECTPESALCVQYLRLLHNFCDRDCDNYSGRRLLLSDQERKFVFETSLNEAFDISHLPPGLLSKIIAAFIGESDESPYRFWLASCVESYLRGSSPSEQAFVARSGLLKNLINDITSERLHCAGSLQTSFDLLGELCKGNAEVLRLLVSDLDEESFRKLMSVAAANLVDSNVFIRSLLLSLERMSSSANLMPLHLDPELFVERGERWRSNSGVFSRSYLTHSWWDNCIVNLDVEREAEPGESTPESRSDASRPADWFPALGTINMYGMKPPETEETPSVGLNDGVGHFGWVFTPVGDALSSAAHAPNTVERLSWFLAANQTRLLRDLLGVVDLRNINHENICCLNTAVVIAIFAYRRQQLHILLQDLRIMNEEERETKRRALDAVRNDNVIDRAFVQAMKYIDIDQDTPAYARRASLTRRGSLLNGSNNEIGDRNDVLRNFRELCWFWLQYYNNRGRDRLSLEFSSHLRFQEWIEVVALLGADDGAPTSLVRSPVRLPRSPYQRAARVAESLQRGG